MGHLTIIIPVTVAAIFFPAVPALRSLKLASLIILVLPLPAWAG